MGQGDLDRMPVIIADQIDALEHMAPGVREVEVVFQGFPERSATDPAKAASIAKPAEVHLII